MKNVIFILGLFRSAQLFGMEAPPSTPMEALARSASFDNLPTDVKRLIVPLIASSKITEVANTILALNRTNKFFHTYIKSPAGMISILEQMPYTAIAIDLVALLQKTNLPVVKNTEIAKWVEIAKKNLEYCEDLQLAIINNDYVSLQYYLKKRNVDLNCQPETSDGRLFGPTPLISAVFERKAKMVELLLSVGANQRTGAHQYIKNIKGMAPPTARTIALSRGYREIVNVFDKAAGIAPANPNPASEEVAPLLPPSSKKPRVE